MALEYAIAVFGVLISIMGIVAAVMSIKLAISYAKYNNKTNSAGMTGEQVARKILDDHGLDYIKVSGTGAFLFGNSYSHYFKKVRLRRMTRHQNSLTALGMGAQKAALAVLAEEGDPDMQRRIRLVPLVSFGPLAFIPLIAVGAFIDYYFFDQNGICTIIMGGLGLLFYIYSVVLTVTNLKTEKKAQIRAREILVAQGLVTAKEAEHLDSLFHLYNIQYIIDIIIAVLEMIYYAKTDKKK